MNAQIEEFFVKKCRTCSQCKHAPRPKAAVQNHKDTQNIFEMVAIDIASMPTSVRGNGYFLLIVDNYSKLMTAIAMQDAKAETITDKLWRNWFCYFGIPKFLQSDQGSNVDGEKFRKLCADLAIKKVRSSNYHPQGNGSAERAIGFLKTILRSMCLSRSLNISRWDDVLPEAIQNCNNTTNASTKFSPSQVAYGTPANMPLDNKLDIPQLAALDPGLIRENVRVSREEARRNYQRQANKSVTRAENEYSEGDLALFKRTHGKYPKMNPLDMGPYRVVRKYGPVNYEIEDPTTKNSKIVHHDLLKSALSKQDATWFPGTTSDCPHAPCSSRLFLLTGGEPSIPTKTIDRQQFYHNVFSGSDSASIRPTQPTATQVVRLPTSRSGRTLKPVRRLIEDI